MGRKLGLSDDEISKLAVLSESDFAHKEWVALNYVRDFATLGGKEPDEIHLKEFHNLYSKEEQKHILKTAMQMDFFNRLFITISRKKPAEQCSINLKK